MREDFVNFPPVKGNKHFSIELAGSSYCKDRAKQGDRTPDFQSVPISQSGNPQSGTGLLWVDAKHSGTFEH